MKQWSFDILRQSDWDLWVWVCVGASLALLGYVFFGELWRKGPRGWLGLGLIAAGLVGTVAVLAVPGIRSARVGFFWTFGLLAILAATFIWN